MRKYFGTDGIRRIANTELTPELVYKVAKSGAYVLSKHTDHVPTILIGRDTRLSGTLIESAMVAGFLSYGANVKLLGVIPTPAVAYLTRKLKADASVVISASHNTYEFNGIKFFSNKGMKIPDSLEEEIEEVMESGKIEELTAVRDKIGIYENCEDLIDEYVYFFRKNFDTNMEKIYKDDFVIGIDTANGATYKVVEKIFTSLGIRYKIINNNPNGININDKCGSTHLEGLKKFVVENNLDAGFAYDGDADRCLAVDEKGNLVDGDAIIYICGKYLRDRGRLNNNKVVTTVMSNLGLYKALDAEGIGYEKTAVGDKYVYECMMENGYILGGEQSGHIIFSKNARTGDGVLTSLKIMEAMVEEKMPLSELTRGLTIYPQLLVNVKVTSKKEVMEDADVLAAAKKVEEALGDDGRILLRQSGTEPLIRVMVEAKTDEICKEHVDAVVDVIRSKGYEVQ